MNIKNMNMLVLNGAKVVIALAGALAVAEAGVMGADAACKDAKAAGACIKHAVDPTPVKVKMPGVFGKNRVVKINPVTGQMKDYTGDKEPVNKKPIKLRKK